MQKRHPAKGGAVLLGGEHRDLTEKALHMQPADGLMAYRALHLIARFQVPPEIAVALAAVAFGGGR